MDDLHGLVMVNPQIVQRLRLAVGLGATGAIIPLHPAVFVSVETEFLTFTTATMTGHLILSRPRLTVIS
jgi:hypothetical protein